MEFRELETFVWVATLGSFRGAAVKLNTTQPAVSQRIQRLEADLGSRLLVRDGRQVVPTAAGLRLLDHAERLLRQRAELVAAVCEAAPVAGTLRLGVSETICHTWLPRFVEQVAQRWPGLSLDIDVGISPALRGRLLAQEIDLAFMVGPFDDPAVKARHLCRFPVGFVASPRLGLGRGPVSVAGLAAHPIITFARHSLPYVAVREALALPGRAAPQVHASASFTTIVRMAVDGVGIAAITPQSVAGEIARGELQVIETPVTLPDLDFIAAWRSGPQAHAPETVAALAIEIAASA